MNNLKAKRKHILGAPVDDVSMEEVISWCNKAIELRNQAMIVTFNAYSQWWIHRDDNMKHAVNSADLVLPEFGMFWAAKKTGQNLNNFILGIELMRELLRNASEENHRIYFLGAEQSVQTKLVQKMKLHYPNLLICGNHHGYFPKEEEAQIINEIVVGKPDVLFVALGTPRQEVWIAQHREELQVPVMFGVGGSFDVLAGKKKDTPSWARGHGFEWLYRTIQDPRTYFKRYITVNSWLVWQVIKENLRL